MPHIHRSASVLARALLAASLLAAGGILPGCGDKGDGDTAGSTDTDTETDTDTVGGGDDADGDGFASDVDCDDGDAGVNPDADEICDGIDNDCDGTLDLDPVAPLHYADTDGDGFGDPADAEAACFPLAGRVDDATDCDDTEADVHPGAVEACNDRDDDCDPATHEDGVISVGGAGSYANIQEAVDAAVTGSVIDLCAGTYTESVITAKGLAWIGHGGRDAVTIDAGGFAPTLRVTEGELTHIEGITLRNGSADFGGCLSIATGDLELSSARLTGCVAATGGGLSFSGDQVFADDTEFLDNGASVAGGGIWAGFNAEIRLTNCVVSGNTASDGGGLFGEQSSDFLLTTTDVVDNAASATGGGVSLHHGSTIDLAGGALLRNTAQDGGGVLIDDSTLAGHATDMGAGGDDNAPEDVFVVKAGAGWSWEGIADPVCDADGCS